MIACTVTPSTYPFPNFTPRRCNCLITPHLNKLDDIKSNKKNKIQESETFEFLLHIREHDCKTRMHNMTEMICIIVLRITNKTESLYDDIIT